MAFVLVERGRKYTRYQDPVVSRRYRLELSPSDQNYIDDSGNWQAIDERQTDDPDFGKGCSSVRHY